MLKGVGKNYAIAVLAFILVLIFAAPLASPVLSTIIEPFSAGECEECHTGFQPMNVKTDSPSEVPVDFDFEAGVLIENPWTHELKDTVIELDISSMPYVEFSEITTLEDQQFSMEGSVPGGGRATHDIDVSEHSVGVTIDLSWNSPILFLGDIDLTVRGPNGGQWNSDTAGTEESIHISEGEIASEGTGSYTIGVESETGLRSVSYSLSVLIENQASTEISQIRVDSIGSMEDSRVKFKLHSYEKGEGVVNYRITSNAHHTHEGRGVDDDSYEMEGSFKITVGDSYSYDKASSSVTTLEGLWIMGRVFGFVSAALYLTAFFTGGSSKKFGRFFHDKVKKAKQWHCVISFGALLSVVIHLMVLYSGVYSGTWKGIYLGGAALLLMAMVAFTGIFREAIVDRIGKRNWKRLHFWSSIAIILLFVVHAVLEGTDLAFLRVW